MRDLLSRSIDLGRRYSETKNKSDFYEALRLLGTGLHCLEDYAAHSNYTELTLIELGERDIFPHVGRRTQIELHGARDLVYPIVTGTFGGVDFFHSVIGEFSDKTAQSEIQSLEGVMEDSQNEGSSQSFLQDLLDKIPSGVFGDSDNSGKMNEFQSNSQEAKKKNENVSPREPEEWARYVESIQRDVYPILEWHDKLLQQINEAIEKIPVIPDLIEQVQEQLNVFVFSVIAPYIIPLINQVKNELLTGSSEVIQSSKAEQHNIFNDDHATDPTHSMLSKDHFSNVLNEPAGKVASQVVKWVVPQIVECWDNDRVNVDRTLDRIINGVLHHPALRQYGEDGASDIRHQMFQVVEKWWDEQGRHGQDSLRRQLSREGVRNGDNHKEGVHDSGHGCGKPLSLPNKSHNNNSGGSSSGGRPNESSGKSDSAGLGKLAEKAVGGGVLGSLVGGVVGEASSGFFGGGNKQKEKKSKDEDRHDAGSEDERRHEDKHTKRHSGHDSYSQSHSHSHSQGGGHRRDDYDDGRQSYGQHSGSTYGGGGSGYGSSGYGGRHEETSGYGGGYQSHSSYERPTSGHGRSSGYGGNRYEEGSGGYGGSSDRYGDSGSRYGGSSGGYGSSTGGYGGSTGDYGGSSGGYGESGSRYGGSAGGYTGTTSRYEEGGSGYGGSHSGYGGSSDRYGSGGGTYGGSSGGYGETTGGYGGSSGYGNTGSGYGGSYGGGISGYGGGSGGYGSEQR